MEMQHKKFFGQRNHQIGFLSYVKCVCCFLLVLAGATQSISAAPLSNQSTQQVKKKVVGTVRDENGEPMIGVTIAIKGQSAGTTTDVSGNFSLELSDPNVLVISYIGYTRQFIDFKGQQTINIKMESDVKKLDEVVVVGYGTQKSKNITGSIATIDMSKVEGLPTSTLTASLSGQIPGLTITEGSGRPGANDASASVRQSFGFSKDGSNNVPLVIIDDVIQIDPSSGLSTMATLNMLDPSEVESITVLRDASAAIYGSRASQGAIIVKTKRGKSGAPKVTYSGKFETNDAVSHTKTLNAYQYGLFSNSFLRSSGVTASANLFSDSELEQMKSLNYNWIDKAWSSAQVMQHSINVNGGTEKATYFAGISYYKQGANLSNQDYSKYTFRTGVDVQVASNLKLSATVSANNGTQVKSFTKVVGSLSDGSYGSKATGEQADYGLLVHMPQYIPWSYNVNGTDEWVSPSLGTYKVTATQNTANAIGAWNYFALLNSGSKQTQKNTSYNANFSLTYTIPFVKGLSVKGTYARTNSTENTEQDALAYTLALATNTNTDGNHLYSSNSTWSVASVNKNSRVDYTDKISDYQQMNFYMNYDRTFGSHSISAMASVERSTTDYQIKFYEYDTPLQDSYNGASTSAGTLNTGNSYTSRTAMNALSYFGRINYSYENKYLAQFILRADASTKFAPENYWGFFPNLSLGWVASEEPWFKNSLKWIDFLKVRASVGETGKDNIKPWRWMQTFTYATKGLGFGTSNGGNLGSGLSTDPTPNRDVRWDLTVKYNFGLDFNVLNNRLAVKWDAYFDRTSGLLTTMSSASGVPISVGGAYAEQNYSIVNDWGTELSINWKDKIGEVSYNVGVNYSWGDNKIIKYPSSAATYESANNYVAGGSTIMPVWGFNTWKGNAGKDGVLRTQSDIDSYWTYLTNLATAAGTTPSYLGITSKSGMSTGMLAYKDVHGAIQSDGTYLASDGRINTNEDYVKLVKKNQTYGFTTNLGASWKNFRWFAQVSTSWGGYAAIDYVKQGTSSGQIIWSHESYLSNMYDATTNANGKYPNVAYYNYNGYASDFWQVSSFRCYIKNMGISYTLPKSIVRKLKIDNASLSLTGTNLWDFYNPYPDHYRNMYDNSSVSYPTLRTYSLGVNIAF